MFVGHLTVTRMVLAFCPHPPVKGRPFKQNKHPLWWESARRVGHFISRSVRTTTHIHAIEQTPKTNPHWHCLRITIPLQQCGDWNLPINPVHMHSGAGPLEAEPCSLFVHCTSPSRMAFFLSLALYLCFLSPHPPHPRRQPFLMVFVPAKK